MVRFWMHGESFRPRFHKTDFACSKCAAGSPNGIARPRIPPTEAEAGRLRWNGWKPVFRPFALSLAKVAGVAEGIASRLWPDCQAMRLLPYLDLLHIPGYGIKAIDHIVKTP